jgi:hypothetical protein
MSAQPPVTDSFTLDEGVTNPQNPDLGDDILTRETSLHPGEIVLTPAEERFEEEASPAVGPIPPETGQNDADESDTDRQIRELELWEEKQRRQEKLRRLRDRRRRYEEGDHTAIQGDLVTPPVTTTPAIRPTALLPRPDPPEKYEKRDRAQYNRWERDCERYFDQTPQLFELNQQKIDFGERYVAEPLKSLWSAWVRDRNTPAAYAMRSNFTGTTLPPAPLGPPSWKEFKEVMLNALGSKMERRHVAHTALTRRRQKQEESPTELLDALRPLWEELQEEVSEGYKVLQYTSALRRDIQDDLSRAKDEDKGTLVQIEDLANRSWRRLGQNQQYRTGDTKKSTNRAQSKTHDTPGDTRTPKKAKKSQRGRGGPNGAESTKKDNTKVTSFRLQCFKCGEVGHKAKVCTKEKKSESSPKENQKGKGKGPKN